MSGVTELEDNVVHVHLVAGQLMLIRTQKLERREPRSVINGLMSHCLFQLNREVPERVTVTLKRFKQVQKSACQSSLTSLRGKVQASVRSSFCLDDDDDVWMTVQFF